MASPRSFARALRLAVAALAVSCSLGGGDEDGTQTCTPRCDGRVCGGDGCGGTCGPGCDDPAACDEATGQCAGPCDPVANCEGRACGEDGCGGSCGECPGDKTCNKVLGRCVGGCDPLYNCQGRECGPDGCGGTCGFCGADFDCADGHCSPSASCTNGVEDGAETDVDCGGACPDKCVVDKGCKVASDCLSGICTGEVCRPDLSCQDGAMGSGETDIDCGGPKCKACAVTKFCAEHRDCLSLACIYGVCKEPTCVDKAKNQDESDTDCGGSCPPCEDGKSCKEAGDCASDACEAWTCISCTDGARNGDETDVDCGGGCAACGLGKKCAKPSDCSTGGCEDGVCCKANACGVCTATPTEVCNGKDDDCDGQTDEGDLCGANQECVSARKACACSGGYHECGSGCVRDDSPDHCGTSCKPCPGDAHGEAVCDEGQCGLDCAYGYRQCGAACAACPSGGGPFTCTGSACTWECGEGKHACEWGCAADTDAGACGPACETCGTVNDGAKSTVKASCDGGHCAVSIVRGAGYYGGASSFPGCKAICESHGLACAVHTWPAGSFSSQGFGSKEYTAGTIFIYSEKDYDTYPYQTWNYLSDDNCESGHGFAGAQTFVLEACWCVKP